MIESIELSPEDAAGPWAEVLRKESIEALALAQERLGVALDAPPRVESAAPEAEFYRLLGSSRPHNLVAVAFSGENRVLINRAKFLSDGRNDRMTTLVHEMAHLIIGRRIPEAPPRWLNEGLAMIAAKESHFGSHARLSFAATFGGLLPLDEMWTGTSSPDQELAYAQSLSAARFMLAGHGGGAGPEDPAPFVRRLADPAEGAALRALLHSSGYMENFERRWRDSIRTPWSLFAALSGTGIFWILVTLLFMLAVWRKRRMSRRIEERWESEGGGAGEDSGDDLTYLDD